MPSTPHFTSHAAVLVLSLLVTVAATRWSMAERGYPGDPLRWPVRFLRQMSEGFRRGSRETLHWTVTGVFAIVITVLHFGGIRYDVYTTVHWWDLLTHVLGGTGVGVLLYLTFHEPASRPRSPRWLAPAVLAFGAGFEVYEFVFKDFWYDWTTRYYVVDTVVDLVAGLAGGAAVAALVWWRNRSPR